MAATGSTYKPTGQKVTLPLGNKKAEDVLLWRDPKISGAYFAGITLVYLLLEWSNWSLLSIISRILLFAIIGSFLYNNAASFTNRPPLPVPSILKTGVSDSQLRSVADDAATYINKALAFLNRVFTGKDVVLTVQLSAVLFVVMKLGGFFTSLGLVYTLVVLAFTVPKGYEMKKHEVDQVITQVHGQTKSNYKQYVEPYLNKIPRASTSTTTSTANANAGEPAVDSGYTQVSRDIPTSDPAVKKVM